MSLKAMSWALHTKTLIIDDSEIEVTPTQKLILVVLGDHADIEGRCFPSHNRLSLLVGIGVQAIRKNLARLESGGLLVREIRFRPDGSQTSNSYKLQIGVVSEYEGGGTTSVPNETSNKSNLVTKVTRSLSSGLPFDEFKKRYPKRDGRQGWPEAEKRGAKMGKALQQTVLLGVENYMAHCKKHGLIGSRHVSMASTFLSPTKKPYSEWAEMTKAHPDGRDYYRLPPQEEEQ